jgi:U11/U12 small nuclear ribonucleoprotein SNRNP65
MAEKLHLADLSSDESEMESSDVLATSYVCASQFVISLPKELCTSYLLQEDVDRKIKRAKHEAIVGPAVDKSVSHEAVGVKPAALVSNELQVIKKKNPVMQVKHVFPELKSGITYSSCNEMVLCR